MFIGDVERSCGISSHMPAEQFSALVQHIAGIAVDYETLGSSRPRAS